MFAQVIALCHGRESILSKSEQFHFLFERRKVASGDAVFEGLVGVHDMGGIFGRGHAVVCKFSSKQVHAIIRTVV